MNITILDDYQDTIRTLKCFGKVAGHHVTVCTTDAFSSTSRLAAPPNGSVAPLPHYPIAPLPHCSTASLPYAVAQERVFPNVSNWLGPPAR